MRIEIPYNRDIYTVLDEHKMHDVYIDRFGPAGDPGYRLVCAICSEILIDFLRPPTPTPRRGRPRKETTDVDP